MSPNNGILLNGILRSELLSIPFASCSFINLDFLLLHTAHFHDHIVQASLVFETFGFMFPVFFCASNNMTCFVMACV